MRLRRPALLTAVLAAGLALAACGSSAGAASSATTSAGDDFPVTLTNTFGTTTIESKPTRVAAVAWSNGTTALALGVVPVGIAKSTYGVTDGSGMLPWTKERVQQLGRSPVLFDETDGINAEQVADTDPDVILASYSGLTQENYQTLSKIAPTVSFPKLAWGTSWRDEITTESTAIGMAAQGRALVASLEKQIAAGVDAHPSVRGRSVALAYVDPTNLSTISIYTSTDNRVQYLTDLGMTVPTSVQKLSDGSSFYAQVSAENADTLADIDVLVMYGDASLLATLQADPLLSKIPAIARGSVALIQDNTPLAAAATPDALSIPWALDDYLSALSAAADKVS